MGLQRHLEVHRLELDQRLIMHTYIALFIIILKQIIMELYYLPTSTALASLRSNCLDRSKYKLG